MEGLRLSNRSFRSDVTVRGSCFQDPLGSGSITVVVMFVVDLQAAGVNISNCIVDARVTLAFVILGLLFPFFNLVAQVARPKENATNFATLLMFLSGTCFFISLMVWELTCERDLKRNNDFLSDISGNAVSSCRNSFAAGLLRSHGVVYLSCCLCLGCCSVGYFSRSDVRILDFKHVSGG